MEFSPERAIFESKEKLSKEDAEKILEHLSKFFDEENYVKNGEGRDMEYFIIYRDGEPSDYLLKFEKFPIVWEENGGHHQADEHVEYVLEARLRFPDVSLHEAVNMVKKERNDSEANL